MFLLQAQILIHQHKIKPFLSLDQVFPPENTHFQDLTRILTFLVVYGVNLLLVHLSLTHEHLVYQLNYIYYPLVIEQLRLC